MLYYERKLKKQGYLTIIGVDEAGRGPLAGPVVAAAVNLGSGVFSARIDDSKKLSASQRACAYEEIIKGCDFGITAINQDIIDKINILEATKIAMLKAVAELLAKIKAKDQSAIHILVDGNMRLDTPLAYTSIIKGDARSKSIAAASILAKVTRDNIMMQFDKEFPEYGFCRHKGYPTEEHRRILRKLGPSIIHRKSFSCV
jgi:ribonuclease HII